MVNDEQILEPPVSDELYFDIALPPVSTQAAAFRKNQLRSSVEAQVGRCAFIMTSDVQVDITWWVHEHSRYETDASPDLDNIVKPLLDGLCGPQAVLVDDSQIQFLGCKWVDWNSPQHRVELRIRLNDGLWIRKPHLLFVQLEQALCWPINVSLPPRAQRLMLDTVIKMMGARRKLLDLSGDYYLAKNVMPMQRLFHVTRTRGFPRRSLSDFCTELDSLLQSSPAL